MILLTSCLTPNEYYLLTVKDLVYMDVAIHWLG